MGMPQGSHDGINWFDIGLRDITAWKHHRFVLIRDVPIEFPKSMDCDHNWKKYVGLTETYSYCTLCDKKEDV